MMCMTNELKVKSKTKFETGGKDNVKKGLTSTGDKVKAGEKSVTKKIAHPRRKS